MNATQIATFAPAGSTYAEHTAPFTARAAMQTLAFVGTNTAFLDHVRLVALPPEGDPDHSSVTPASESQLRMFAFKRCLTASSAVWLTASLKSLRLRG